MASCPRHVRYSPESGHAERQHRRLLCAMCGRLLVGKGFLARMQPWSTCNLRHALVAGIRDNSKRLFNTLPSHRGYDSELGHVGADGIDHRALLANEDLAGAMQRQAALLLGRLGLDKPIARAS